jgi:hypothetical protein
MAPMGAMPIPGSGKIFSRGQIAKSHVRTALIVVASPRLDQPPGLCDRGEPVQVEAFIAEGSVERFDVGVVRRLAWSREVDPQPVVIRSQVDEPSGELPALCIMICIALFP